MKVFRIQDKITSRETGTFKQYLNDIANIKPFTPSEEEACAKMAAMGDKAAIDELVTRNLRFVVTVAKQYETSTISLEDLVNEGNIGLILAAEKYNLTMGFKFITYGVFWIRKLILEYLSNHSKLIRLPTNKISNISKLTQKVNALEQSLGREVDITEVNYASDSDLSDEDILELQRISNISFESFDSPLDGDEVGSRYDFIANTNEKTTDHIVLDTDLKNQINDILNILKPRDKKVMISLFGLDGSNPLTLKEVSEDVGLTSEMVRKIKESSLVKLRNKFTL